jgi:hypothetical protein
LTRFVLALALLFGVAACDDTVGGFIEDSEEVGGEVADAI